jgi:hypothetical protein
MKSAEEIKLGTRCPCGGIILADTDECKVPVCFECCIEISNAYLNKDDNYNEGFTRGQQSERARAGKLVEALENAKQVILDKIPVENCHCHINPPCTACTDGPQDAKDIEEALAEYERGE